MHFYPKILSSKDVRGQDVFLFPVVLPCGGYLYGIRVIMRLKNTGYKKSGIVVSVYLQDAESGNEE